jgi:uncharacterized protein with von Willebrand factor type A (vWA) domain
LEEQTRQESGGHSLADRRRYQKEIEKWQEQIAQMRDVFKTVITERVAQRRGLSRRPQPEGAILDPDRIAQTVADIKSGVEHPDAFRAYESQRRNTEMPGKTDYVFLVDISGSMSSYGRSEAAAASIVIALEGLAAMQRDIETAQSLHNIELDLDIRTAIYSFGDGFNQLKALSNNLNLKERLDTHQAISNPNDGSTQDYLALQEIQRLEVNKERRQIVVVITDGQSDNTQAATKAIDALRASGWFVYGISIGTEDAVTLYAPTSQRIDDPAILPKTIKRFIEETIL